MAFKILVVDDEENVGRSISHYLCKDGYQTAWAKDGQEALELLSKEDFHLIFLDLIMPGLSGMPLLERIKREFPTILVIILTAIGDIQIAVQAMKMGAFDYITKSSDLCTVRSAAHNARDSLYSQKEEDSCNKKFHHHYPNKVLIGNSIQIRKVRYLINKVSKIDQSTILLIGESGSGKELVANSIHRQSPRAAYPFIDISCSALPNHLMESELFGFEQGAFTDAKNQKAGLIELAKEGTLFLDEIGSLDFSMQAKLLRFLEQRSFRRIGGVKDIFVNITIIAATNNNLENMVIEGNFRHDLYYRLNVFLIEIPPLRKRREDIPLLVNHFIKKFNFDFHKDIKSLHADALKMLMEYNYPGNVRELKNILERAMIMEEGDFICPETISFFNNSNKDYSIAGNRAPNYIINNNLNGLKLKDIEKRYILEILEQTKGNKAKAATILGIARSTLFKKIREYNLNH
ncbi:MAG: sigma-54-dependent transcriptional regulator [bacterium]